jgi:hypothetical protein
MTETGKKPNKAGKFQVIKEIRRKVVFLLTYESTLLSLKKRKKKRVSVFIASCLVIYTSTLISVIKTATLFFFPSRRTNINYPR